PDLSCSSTLPRPTHKPKAPGLNNLGNTCFFNSTLQAVAVIPMLRVAWSADNVFPPFGPSASVGPLRDAFKDVVVAMWTQQGGTVNPNQLFGQITKRWKQFRGMRQQDAHELMRFMFDGVRNEEVQEEGRGRTHAWCGLDDVEGFCSHGDVESSLLRHGLVSMLTKTSFSRSSNPLRKKSVSVAKPKRKKRKPVTVSSEASAATPTVLAQFNPLVDTIFGGRLVSVIVCDVCK
ncbi:hypothetical protein BC937DRAFT_87857, partial [Endogone sp. FLAS-F59071]